MSAGEHPVARDLCALSLGELSRALRGRRVTSSAATRACLARIDERNGELNAFLAVTAEAALAAAAQMDAELREGRYRGPLHGVPVALKDLYDTAGVPTTAGSAVLRNRVPEQDATVVRRLRRAGAVLLGKTHLHEFAFGATNLNEHYGPARNPHDPTRMTGGSSGGSAAAVAAGMCYGALGSDTGGSIRCPAALCGIVGLKPTYGRVSRAGVLPLAWSLDHAGPMTRTVEDAALLLETIAGYDAADRTSAMRPVPAWGASLEAPPAGEAPLGGLRVGVPQELFWDPIQPGVADTVRAGIARLAAAGATVAPLSLPFIELALAAQLVILHAEAAAYHRPLLRRHADRYDPRVRARLLQGLTLSSSDYLDALRARGMVREKLLGVLRVEADLLATPAVPLVAPPLEAKEVEVGTVLSDPQAFMVRNTFLFNLTGFPALSVPCGTAGGLPVGLQLAAGPWKEALLFRAARVLEG
jgi:aspartyl-tRNA(Asn)/glutamyl-tRNA(Gln) amidotransferase subunit A